MSLEEEEDEKVSGDDDDCSSMVIGKTVLEDDKSGKSIKEEEEDQKRFAHPLELNDELAFRRIRTVRLDFLTDEATSPIPRCQDLPSHAFSRVGGRSILVSLIHGWFFQAHPDPYGAKLDLIRNVFAPRLRERYPHTDIQIFYDFVSLPQEPRTDDEEECFVEAVSLMESMYVYADVILCLKMDLPELDMTIHTATVDVSTYSFFDYIGTVQVFRTSTKTGPQRMDCILTCDGEEVKKCGQISNYEGVHTFTYLQRPFGRPNTTPSKDRGWLFLEHIAVAIKAAAADKSQFDDIVLSNSEKLRTKIFVWSDQIRYAAQKQKSLCNLMDEFKSKLETKQFTSQSSFIVAQNLMYELVQQTEGDWDREVEKQTSMSKRAREILLRWGCFSEGYVERAELLFDSKEVGTRKRSWVLLSVILGMIAPMVTILPYSWSLEGVGEDPSRDKVLLSSVWLGRIEGYVKYSVCTSRFSLSFFLCSSLYRSLSAILLHAINLAFAKIPIGSHTICACVALSVVCVSQSLLLRAAVTTIMPFEALFVAMLGVIVSHLLYAMIKFIPVKDKRTGQTKRWAIGTIILTYSFPLKFCYTTHDYIKSGTWLHMPPSHRFDLKARAAVKRSITTTYVFIRTSISNITSLFNCTHIYNSQFTVVFGLAYPLLGGLFFQSGIFVQALLIPVFFIIRAGFEYGADTLTAHTFGSDGMPAINFAGVLMHEVCLSVMITSIKHPLVFVSLVMSDVLENSFCLWSLARNTKMSSNRVSPAEDNEKIERQRKSLARRPSNVVSLVMNKDNVSDKGTALFIAATLLQREAVETIVPIQAAAILSFLYKIDVKSNSIVTGWSDEDWAQSLTYIGVDLGVELMVFACTIFALKRIYPEFDAGRILRGLLRMHWVEMSIMCVVVWLTNLIYQSTYSGMDMSLEFPWLKNCKNSPNSTWLGGFEWEC